MLVQVPVLVLVLVLALVLDLVKVLLRHAQACLGLGQADEAKEKLLRAADIEPNNRAVREELSKAKKAVRDEERLKHTLELIQAVLQCLLASACLHRFR